MTMEKPDIVEDKHLHYLDSLRDSGLMNMLSAPTFIENSFDVSHKDAKAIVRYWMDTYEERTG